MAVKYSEEPQGTEAWLQERVGLLTASRFAKAMSKGKGRQDLLHELRFQRRIGGYGNSPASDETYKSAAMVRGNRLEPEARLVAGMMLGEEIKEVGLALNDDYPGIGASLDGLIGDTIGIEIKCPLGPTHDTYLKQARLPAVYKWQVHGQMLVCALEAVWFMSYHPDDEEVLLIKIERDHDLLDELVAGLKQFFMDLEQLEQA